MRGEVLDGTVEVAGTDSARDVGAGFGVVAEPGKPIGEPRKLLSPPDLSRLPSKLELSSSDLSWPALKDAQSYRVQMAPNEEFDVTLVDAKVDTPSYTVVDIPEGNYVLRVRGVDAVGLEGVNAEHGFALDRVPIAPVLDLPAVDGARVRIHWQPVENAQNYMIQLARDREFKQIFREIGSNEASVELNDINAGEYFTRVSVVAGDGSIGPYSEIRTFRVAINKLWYLLVLLVIPIWLLWRKLFRATTRND